MGKRILLAAFIALASLFVSSMAEEPSASYLIGQADDLLKASSNTGLNQNDSKLALLGAFEAYDKALKMDPQMAEAWVGKGRVLYKLRMADEAAASYDRYLDVHPENNTVRALLIEALMASRRNDEALNQTDLISDADPSSEGWINRGKILMELGKLEDALDSFNRSLYMDPKSVQALYWKAGTLAEMGGAERSLEFYDEATRIDPGFVEAWRDKGFVLKSLGREDEAIEAFSSVVEIYNKTIEQYPDDIDSLIGRCGALAYLNKYDEADSCYDEAIELNPDSLSAWNSRGVTLYHLGRYDEAIKCFDRVLEIDPGYDRAWYFKGLALDKLGRNNESQNAFAQAESFGFETPGPK
ncbi:MAG: lipoprotein NlpI [Methanosaeta sp. PtaB.Bin039]|nr:MAG: lipoprotein NlpI [Methanosaeta sp. PtaB.Bin039]HOT08011.1 tetratricopeptide repeat protein [Methanotrichaceae archaeon]HQI92351.1 tetratricopeptide repeat protein [Methanotrichaceae archaeon]